MDFTPYIGPAVTALIAFGATYAAMSSRIARLETMITELRRDVEKHNRVVERTYALERDMKTAFDRIDELKDEDKAIHDKIERRHSHEG